LLLSEKDFQERISLKVAVSDCGTHQLFVHQVFAIDNRKHSLALERFTPAHINEVGASRVKFRGANEAPIHRNRIIGLINSNSGLGRVLGPWIGDLGLFVVGVTGEPVDFDVALICLASSRVIGHEPVMEH